MQTNFYATIKKADSTDNDGRWVMAAVTPDRVKDTFEPSAFVQAIKSLSDKLIALWQHDTSAPLGYWHNLTYKSGQILGDLKIAETNLGKMVKQLLSDGVPLGASIGFRGTGDLNDIGGIHFDDIELLETSIVSVPANPKAQQILKSFGVDLPSIVETKRPVTSDDVYTKAQAAILAANKLLRTIKNE